MGTVQVGGYNERVTSNVGSFIANLPEMLGAMAVDPRCLVAVIEFEDVRYVQYWVESDGKVIAEVISNLNIGDAVALTFEDEEKLRRAGWSEPTPGPRPNWRFEANDITGLMKVVSMSRDAIYDVLLERDTNTVSVRMWEGRRYTFSACNVSRGPSHRYHEMFTRKVSERSKVQ
ncbi:MAG TPA: hypothetical protein VMU68_12395 [Acidimicrobiales bacterium]|nr:hypothetical protein [Acidimicrobiales bacterium]